MNMCTDPQVVCQAERLPSGNAETLHDNGFRDKGCVGRLSNELGEQITEDLQPITVIDDQHESLASLMDLAPAEGQHPPHVTCYSSDHIIGGMERCHIGGDE